MTEQDIKMHRIVYQVIRVLMDERITISDELSGALNEAVRKGLAK